MSAEVAQQSVHEAVHVKAAQVHAHVVGAMVNNRFIY